ncbi:hypothetical protein PENTCL1PPCAC_22098, partial [Pristionchus entomophagus]
VDLSLEWPALAGARLEMRLELARVSLHEDSVGGELVEGGARGHHVVDSLESDVLSAQFAHAIVSRSLSV